MNAPSAIPPPGGPLNNRPRAAGRGAKGAGDNVHQRRRGGRAGLPGPTGAREGDQTPFTALAPAPRPARHIRSERAPRIAVRRLSYRITRAPPGPGRPAPLSTGTPPRGRRPPPRAAAAGEEGPQRPGPVPAHPYPDALPIPRRGALDRVPSPPLLPTNPQGRTDDGRRQGKGYNPPYFPLGSRPAPRIEVGPARDLQKD